MTTSNEGGRKALTMASFSKMVRNLRGARNLTQAEFAKELDCSVMTVSRWERALAVPARGRGRADLAKKLAEKYPEVFGFQDRKLVAA